MDLDERMDLVRDRADLLDALVGEPLDRRDLVDRAGALLLLTGAERELGSPDEAAEHLDAAADIVERLDSALGRVWCARERGHLARARGDDERARGCFEDGLESAREHGFRPDEAALLAALADLDTDPDRARERLATAVERYRECAANHRALDLLERLVYLCAAAGDTDVAVDWCETSMEVAAGAGLVEERAAFAERRDALDG